MRKMLLLMLLWTPAVDAATQGVYKCLDGERTVYQESPCENGDQGEIADDRLSIVDAFKGPRISPRPVRPKVRRAVSRRAGIDEAEICRRLRTRLARIDALARQRSTQRLTDERREVKARLYELRCSELGPIGGP